MDSRHWYAPVRCRFPGRTCLSVAAEVILTEDLPQLPLQIATVHTMLYALDIFKIYASEHYYKGLYRSLKSTCYTYIVCQEAQYSRSASHDSSRLGWITIYRPCHPSRSWLFHPAVRSQSLAWGKRLEIYNDIDNILFQLRVEYITKYISQKMILC